MQTFAIVVSLAFTAVAVVMTARADVDGTVGAAEIGLWGGLVINGRAPINACIDGTATGGTVWPMEAIWLTSGRNSRPEGRVAKMPVETATSVPIAAETSTSQM